MKNLNDSRRLILLELNEVNFDACDEYTKRHPGKFLAIEALLKGCFIRTTSETEYEYLEPWIQWVSVHTGLSYEDHKIFRLGDIVGSHAPQLFELLEGRGLSVGVISAMNTENRLANAAYFIPDPWTITPSDSSFWSKLLSQAVTQAVNDNAKSKITIKSLLSLLFIYLRFARFSYYPIYFNLAITSKNSSWRKALFLDLLLNDVHLGLLKHKKPNFSTLFLNAGAHIQHHFFFNSHYNKKQKILSNPSWYLPDHLDPFAEMLDIYNTIVADYLSINNYEIVLVTGLSQKIYDRVKYYYRLSDHEVFLKYIGISFLRVIPRMTRDFLIEFDSEHAARIAQESLSKIYFLENNIRLFGEIDNRGSSLFVCLTYPNEIKKSSQIWLNDKFFEIYPHVVFVAIKNGMHHQEGFAFFSQKIAKYAPSNASHVRNIFHSILNYFNSK